MTEDKKYYVYKMSGHYYTIDTKPVYEKVLFEGTDKECYEFVKKELKKMFEKEALIYATVSLPDGYTKIDYQKKTDWQDGAEFGYNKANEWHYVKDGDLPSDRHGHVVINQDWDKVTIRNGRFEYLDGCKADVIAWKEVVLPELKEIE